MNYSSLAQEVSAGKNIRRWPRNHSFDTLAKNVAAFYTCPKQLPGVKLKSFELMTLPKEISRQSSTDCVMWYLVINALQIHN